jgi:hypothetical protein
VVCVKIGTDNVDESHGVDLMLGFGHVGLNHQRRSTARRFGEWLTIRFILIKHPDRDRRLLVVGLSALWRFSGRPELLPAGTAILQSTHLPSSDCEAWN